MHEKCIENRGVSGPSSIYILRRSHDVIPPPTIHSLPVLFLRKVACLAWQPSFHDVRGIYKIVFPHSQVSLRSASFMSSIIFRFVPTFLCLITGSLPFLLLARAQNLTDGQIDAISARLAESALKRFVPGSTRPPSLIIFSWELGTRSQAILELNATAYSVFSSKTLPPPSTIPSDLTAPLAPFFAIARSVVSNRTAANNNSVGPQPLLPDGSAGDPASIGMCVLLANWTNQDAGKIDYAGAAKDQLDFLFQDVPMTNDGAISHRVSQIQLW